jgi:metallo-beta-lactamase family protein
MLEGADTVKIHGQYIPVAARVAAIDSMSAHADADEILHWLRGFQRPPALTHLVHGEPPAQEALRARIEKELGWSVHVAEYQEQVTI